MFSRHAKPALISFHGGAFAYRIQELLPRRERTPALAILQYPLQHTYALADVIQPLIQSIVKLQFAHDRLLFLEDI